MSQPYLFRFTSAAVVNFILIRVDIRTHYDNKNIELILNHNIEAMSILNTKLMSTIKEDVRLTMNVLYQT